VIPTFDTSGFKHKIWITADFHFGHTNILEYCNRPWTNIDRMDNHLIQNIREVVRPEDILIINGDLTMYGPDHHRYVEKIVKKIPGTKVLVFGNHDRLKPRTYITLGFSLAATSLILPNSILVTHDPAEAIVWPKDKPVLCGHIHELFKVLDNVVNVGVDVHKYYPIELKDAVALADLKSNRRTNWKELSKNRHKSIEREE